MLRPSGRGLALSKPVFLSQSGSDVTEMDPESADWICTSCWNSVHGPLHGSCGPGLGPRQGCDPGPGPAMIPAGAQGKHHSSSHVGPPGARGTGKHPALLGGGDLAGMK